ncbi:MAG: hypothetical protein GXO85_10780, partial [Chlorobi bacterium]|nr:hypothetical protein [Chlorobiota bacterium]
MKQKSKFLNVICIIIFYLTGNLLLAQSKDSLIIADNSQAFYDIILVGESNGVVETSVKDLSKYLQQISGAQFEVKNKKGEKPAIYVGDKDQRFFNGKFSHLQTRNSFSVNMQRDSKGVNDIYLVGQDSTATAFAVYT